MSTVFVLINCWFGKDKDTIDEVKNLDLVKEVQGTFGAYDIIATLQSTNLDEIQDVIRCKIRRIDNVQSTLTLLGIDDQSWKNSN
jgi:DNA-binding Lrp family transcriptional regulator